MISIDKLLLNFKSINYNIDKNIQSKYIDHDFSLK